MKKAIHYLICLLLICFSLAACTPGKKNVSEETPVNTKLPKYEKLTFYFEGIEPVTLNEVEKKLEKKVEKILNVKLDFKIITYDKIRLILSSSEPCDAIGLRYLLVNRLVTEGYLKDITKLMPTHMPSYFGSLTEGQIAAVSYNGKIMAVPNNNLPYTQKPFIAIRKEFGDKYNASEINELNDLGKLAELSKRNNSDLVPLGERLIGTLDMLAEKEGYFILDRDFGIVYKQDDKSMKLMAWEQTPEFRKAINTYSSWNKLGYFGTGANTASISHKSYDFEGVPDFVYTGNKSSAEKTIRFDLFPKSISQRNPNISNVLVFNNNSKKTERCLILYEYLQKNKECYNLVRYGIKGKDYTVDSKGKAKVPKVESYEIAFPNWGGTQVFYNYKNESLDSKLTKAYLGEINRSSKYPYHLGFQIDRDALYKELGEQKLTRLKFSNEITDIIPVVNDSNVDEFISREKASADLTVTLVQKQLDEWLEKAKAVDASVYK